tara:strand:+ start:198 stop:992 length:795 start_codon:yes stop_codon:yes gene_type:complete
VEKLVILVKSYSNHLEYTNQLINTINKHNVDNIKVYLSVPKSQKDMFVNGVDLSNCELLFDEDIIKSDLNQSWFTQQLVKMHFSSMGLCENYLWIDADSYFIKDFRISDFMYNDTTPYTNLTECKDLLTFCAPKGQYSGVFDAYAGDRRKVMEVFGRKGKLFDSVCPNLWSCKVFDDMRSQYLEPNNLTFTNLLQHVPGELIWYTEYLLSRRPIDIVPCEGWFKAFHYLEQMNECRNLGNTEETLSRNYFGIVMPSKETNELRF